MTEWAAVYDTYLKAASTGDPRERALLLARSVTEGFELISPFPYHVTGREAAAAQLGKVAAAMPAGMLRLVRTAEPDLHHGWFRVTYANLGADGKPLSTGLHVVRTEGDRLAQIIVFVPAVAG